MRRKQGIGLLLAALLLMGSLTGCRNGETEKSGGQAVADLTEQQDREPSEETAPETTPAGEALTGTELELCADFLNQGDCYGFLLSDYEDVLDADLSQVFYAGGGVGETPTEEMLASYLESKGYEEAYTEVTFLPEDGVDEVLRLRTGHSLADYRAHGTDGFTDYLDAWHGYFHMAGDTNVIHVVCTAGTRYPDGSLLLESRESNPWEEGDDESGYACTFRTALAPGEDGAWLFAANTITGGWLRDYYDELSSSLSPDSFTAQTPFFDQWYTSLEDPADALPVTLTLREKTDNGVSLPSAWVEAHWDEWMEDPAFLERYPEGMELTDRDAMYLYEPGVGENGAYLNVYDVWSGTPIFTDCDFSAFLYPERLLQGDETVTEDLERSFVTAQSVRWARRVNGNFLVSTFHRAFAEDSAGMNGYLTCLRSDGTILWRTDPLVCNSDNFEILGVEENGALREGVILCGYGFTGEDDYIVQVGLESGRTLNRFRVASRPDTLVYANSALYVHCYDTDYVFDVSFG